MAGGGFLHKLFSLWSRTVRFPCLPSLPAARPSYGGGTAGCPGLQPIHTYASCCLRSGFSFSLREFMGKPPPPSSLWGLVSLPPPSAGRSCGHCPGAGVLLPPGGAKRGAEQHPRGQQDPRPPCTAASPQHSQPRLLITPSPVLNAPGGGVCGTGGGPRLRPNASPPSCGAGPALARLGSARPAP